MSIYSSLCLIGHYPAHTVHCYHEINDPYRGNVSLFLQEFSGVSFNKQTLMETYISLQTDFLILVATVICSSSAVFKSQLCSISSKISGNMKNCHVILQSGLVSQTLQEDRSDVSNHPDRGDQHNPWIHHVDSLNCYYNFLHSKGTSTLHVCYHIESPKETHRHLNKWKSNYFPF